MPKQPRISDKGIVPRGGEWIYVEPQTGVQIRSYQWDQLMGKIVAHRKANNIPVGLGVAEEVERQLCENQPENCQDADPDAPRKRKLEFGDVLRGVKVMAEFKVKGSPLVPRDEAIRRASICAVCEFNVTFPKPCGGLCGQLKDLVTSLIGNEKTPYDEDLRSCAVCGCFTAAHVWMPIDILDKGLTDQMRRQFQNVPGCWKHK